MFFIFSVIDIRYMEPVGEHQTGQACEERVYASAKDLYEPDGIHIDFNDLYASPVEPKEKDSYKYINKHGDQVGKYFAKLPERGAKKILRWIYLKTGIDSPIFKIYNENTRTLYKYAGKVEVLTKKDIKNKGNREREFLKDKKIPIKHKFKVLQIEYKKY